MIQDIEPHRYDLTYSTEPISDGDTVLIFQNRCVLACRGEALRLPTAGELGIQEGRYLFKIDDTAFYMAELPEQVSEEYTWVSMMDIRMAQPRYLAFAVVTGQQMTQFYQSNRYCAGCGTANQVSQTERAMICPKCGKIMYPQICPSVIVAVTHGDKILLTKYAPSHSPHRHYALVAGYNEIGESLEATVRREVMEEVGLKVKNIRYYKSQPWAFSGSLLMGFYCELDGDEAVHLDTQELQEGSWISRGDLPCRAGEAALTAEMIEQFRIGNQS